MSGNGTDTTKVLIGKTTVLFPAAEGATSRSVDVAELKWPDALQFMRMLGDHFSKLVESDREGRMTFDLQKLKEAIPGTGALAEFLVTKATKLTPEQIAELSVTEFLELLAVAMELNLSEDIMGKLNRVVGTVQRTFAKPSAASQRPSTV